MLRIRNGTSKRSLMNIIPENILDLSWSIYPQNRRTKALYEVGTRSAGQDYLAVTLVISLLLEAGATDLPPRSAELSIPGWLATHTRLRPVSLAS